MRSTYKSLFGKEPEVKVMHAGLECGIIQGTYPQMDMVSIGPDLEHPHSPDERLNGFFEPARCIRRADSISWLSPLNPFQKWMMEQNHLAGSRVTHDQTWQRGQSIAQYPVGSLRL